MILALELIAIVAFAISGAMVGISKKMDIFGVVILGTVTSVGGGIIRDLIIGYTPPVAFRHPVYALTAIGVSLLVFLPFIRSRINVNNWVLLIVDSLGLGLYTVLGVKAGMEFDNLFLTVFVGSITGVGGGVLRDVMAGERPMIFVKHFYALPTILGALTCALLWPVNDTAAMIAGASLIVILRLLAAKFRWNMPHA